ncbi:AraC family transcriptional regulator [Marinomonas ushuaiensis DSM 15871]|uniref:AraC family transcriptional regulator n=1 Tax=Marinomonas ushuaiensis DSM 15871 TaxID=1122207 RepID=X7E5R1_9GAMM|nr:helix-turn-helix transcriptional regulator [Marinomonas ushuaiensis]ETX11374.1 AraC family transcriptional regulator [Marinomonas ushuaiensis DSM 15871]
MQIYTNALSANEQINNSGDKFIITRKIDMPAGYQGPLHHHSWYQLMYASKGILHVEYQNQIMLVPPQKAVWLAPTCDHRITAPIGAKFHSLYFRPDVVAKMSDKNKVLDITPLARELILSIGNISHKQVLDKTEQRLIQVLIDQLALQSNNALSLLIPSDKRLNQLITQLIKEPSNSLSIEEWSTTLAISSRTITRIFNKEVGVGFKEWRQKVRLLEAVNLLEQGEMSVTEIALEIGYNSPSAFTYAFKQVFENSPVAYLKKH